MHNQNTLFPITWEQVHRDAKQLAHKLKQEKKFTAIIAIGRGGLVPAAILARELKIDLIDTICLDSNNNLDTIIKKPCLEQEHILIIDDIANKGNTLQTIKPLFPQAHFACLYTKQEGKKHVQSFITEVSQDTWIIFPWDNDA